MNKAFLSGEVSEPTFKQTTNSFLTKFTVITVSEWKDKSGRTNAFRDFHRVVVWGAAAEALESVVKHGDIAVVEGEIRNRTYTDKDGIKRRVTEIIVTTNGKVEILSQQSSGSKSPTSETTDEDIPF